MLTYSYINSDIFNRINVAYGYRISIKKIVFIRQIIHQMPLLKVGSVNLSLVYLKRCLTLDEN